MALRFPPCDDSTRWKVRLQPRIAERPHPYDSRQNDIVRHFHDLLLERLREIAKDHDFIHVEDDVQANDPPGARCQTRNAKIFGRFFQFTAYSPRQHPPVLNLVVWINAMPQTIPGGGSVGIVYAPISLLSFLQLFFSSSGWRPQFVYKVHRLLSVVAFFVFIVSTTYVWLASPFTPNARIRVFFAQKVDLTNVTSAVSRPQLTRAITQLNITEIYDLRLTATLPPSWSSIDGSEGGQCIANKLRRGLMTCEWPVPPALLPSIASVKGGDRGIWLV